MDKKLITERFKELAGIKPLYTTPIQEQMDVSDEAYDELSDLISKYVKDPDDVQRELDRFDDGGFDAMSNMVTANLERDPEYKAWEKKLQTPAELTDEEKDLVDDMMDNMFKRINPTKDIEKSTALFKYIDGYFETLGGTY
tara:strand:- start:2037 stop:2459 length:423 start_codon:yes stop_codon:yes gene_type:complete